MRLSITTDEYVIQMGGDAALKAKFDGREYPITGDEQSKNSKVERVNSTTIREFDLDAAGKIVETDTLTLGSDGRIRGLQERPGEKPQTFYFRRVSGSNSASINGEWEVEMWVQYDPIENGFKVSLSAGGGYTVKFDGKRWPDKEPGAHWDSVQLTRIDDSSFYDIKYKGDVVTYIVRDSISSDGNEVRVESLNPKSGHLQTFLHSRRPADVQRQN